MLLGGLKFKAMEDIRTLCQRCKSDYEDAGYEVVFTRNKVKQPCDICGSQGFDYEIKVKNNEKQST